MREEIGQIFMEIMTSRISYWRVVGKMMYIDVFDTYPNAVGGEIWHHTEYISESSHRNRFEPAPKLISILFGCSPK